MIKPIIFLSLLFFVFTGGYVHAEATAITTNKVPRPTSTEKKDKSQRCADLTKQIDETIAKANADADHPRLQKMRQELATTISKLKAKGYDTSKIEADLATFESKIDACRAAFSNFIVKLTATKSYACGSSEGQFATALKAANADHKANVEPVCQDARTYLNDTLRADLKALKEQAVKPTKTPRPTKAPKPARVTNTSQ